MSDPTGGSRSRHDARRERLRANYASVPPENVVDKTVNFAKKAAGAVSETISEGMEAAGKMKETFQRVKRQIPGLD